MDNEAPPTSHLFTLRVWPEVDEAGETRWRGKLRHIASGEIRHFRGWAALIPLILDMLRRYHNQKLENKSEEKQ